MKVQIKLFGGFTIIAVIGVFLGVTGLYSDRELTSSSEEIIGITETEARISSILNTHYNWRHALTEAVYAET